MRSIFYIFALALAPGVAWAGCSGDLQGVWEKRPAGSQAKFNAIETFTVNSNSGLVEQCEGDGSWDGQFMADNGTLTFTYARRVRILPLRDTGDFISDSWQADFNGKTSEYRVRVLGK